MAKWMLRQTSIDVETLARQTGLDPVLVRLMAVRGYRSPREIQDFLHPENIVFADPLLFADMEKAIHRVRQAIANQEPTVIFGDYDADGIMSTVILARALEKLGLRPSHYIPKREGEGYGLNSEAIRSLAQQGTTLIIACDNGVSAFEQIELANTLGIDIVVIDHHDIPINGEGEQILPQAYAVVDGKRLDCAYPFKYYCAAAMCYRFAEALFHSLNQPWTPIQQELLQLATVATICDIVDMTGENRALVKRGLPLINQNAVCGLHALIQAANITTAIDTYHVGFIIGPCINAAGRMGQVQLATQLFFTEEADEAARLAESLVALNAQRRKMTEDGTLAVFEQIQQQHYDQDKVMVVHAPQITESIAGIIAGRVKERYHRPVIVIGGDGDLLRGSGRSIESYNIFEGLSQVKDLFPSFGGHPLAAGLSILAPDVNTLRQRINQNCQLEEEDFQPLYRIDCALPIQQVSLSLAKQLRLLEPFGKGNEAPLFATKSLRLIKITALGSTGKTLRWLVQAATGDRIEAIDFHNREALKAYVDLQYGIDMWDKLEQGRWTPQEPALYFDLIYTIGYSTYMGKESQKVQVVTFRPASG